MFNLSNNLKRSFDILWKYKVLWIFAFLLAMTSGSSSGGSSGVGWNFPTNSQSEQWGQLGGQWQVWMNQVQTWFTENINPLFATEQRVLNTSLWIIAGVVLLALLVGLLFALVRYPTESAIIRMVDEYETSGTRVRFKEGWKLGWTHRAFRLWVIDLILAIPTLLLVALIIGVTLLALTTAYNSWPAVVPGSWIALAVVGVLIALVLILGTIFLGILRNFFMRATVLEDTTIGESFRRGWQVFIQNAKNTFLVWLVLIGVRIAVNVAMILVFFLLIPIYIILLIPGAIIAAIPSAIGYGITSIFTPQVLPWIVAAIVGLPFLLVVVFAPLILIGGLWELYRSNNWTLAYRQFTGHEVIPEAAVETPPALPG
jgi:hypothetical protein